jgi:uncharacterized protein YcbK (DUF882 family)
MSDGGSSDTGDEWRQDLIRQSDTLRRFLGWGNTAPAQAFLRLASAAMIVAAMAVAPSTAAAEDRALKLYNTHTQERATIVFKRNGRYDRAGLAKVNQFLRDWRRNEPTKMDPLLLDLVWEAYRKTGSSEYIHVISGYRSPATNSALRKRSKGVARNSQHTHGKALDFYIPGVSLAKLRAIGLRAHVGGVGYYPRSGSPFVHMDTGSVRHWPRMSRQQLVKVFPKGKTLHVPSDGKPLRGHAVAVAAHKMRGGSGKITIASYDEAEPAPRKAKRSVGAPIVIASVSDDFDIGDSSPASSGAKSVMEIVEVVVPLPRPSPIPAYGNEPPVIVATAAPVIASLQPWSDPSLIPPIGGSDIAPHQHFAFGSPSHWISPPAPMELVRAMAARDISRSTSLPIYPTAIVATVDVTRPLRAEAITTAVLSKEQGEIRDVTPFFAYAEPVAFIAPATATITAVPIAGIPIPVANPLRVAMADSLPEVTGSIVAPVQQRAPSELTLTALDTLGLRLWIGPQSTRQKQYAVLTMPDFSQIPSLLEKPELTYRAGFGDFAYQGLRTDRFSGFSAPHPIIVDLTKSARLASR